MCIWLHPSDASLRLIIGSDNKANKLFVYDLEGKTIQTIPAEQPGNIDVRYRFPLRSMLPTRLPVPPARVAPAPVLWGPPASRSPPPEGCDPRQAVVARGPSSRLRARRR